MDYQLAFVTPGILPWLANSRKQIRQIWNRRMYACRRPQFLQRLYLRDENFAGRDCFTIKHSFAIVASFL
jgi:hypothetical protein